MWFTSSMLVMSMKEREVLLFEMPMELKSLYNDISMNLKSKIVNNI